MIVKFNDTKELKFIANSLSLYNKKYKLISAVKRHYNLKAFKIWYLGDEYHKNAIEKYNVQAYLKKFDEK